jgi:hypothetical protein
MEFRLPVSLFTGRHWVGNGQQTFELKKQKQTKNSGTPDEKLKLVTFTQFNLKKIKKK